MSDVMRVLETYFDAAPRPNATTEDVGPFTLFVRRHADGWPYYARPRLGLEQTFSTADVESVRRRQRELGVPESIEWVHQTTPSLLDAARSTGLRVAENPLLVLGEPVAAPVANVRVLDPDDDVSGVVSAVHAAFGNSDDVEPRSASRHPGLMRAGLMTMVGAFDDDGVPVGGGSHSPRGETTELTGIGVLPRARRRGRGWRSRPPSSRMRVDAA